MAANSGTPGEIARESAAEPRSGERSRAHLLLALFVVCFVVFASLAVPRLTNNLIGDIEFTGWSGPFANRILRGEAPYVDFVLPIPPGSFVVLALVQKLSGRALLLQELWLIALCQLAMGLIAYAIVRPFTGRQTSALVAFASLVTLLQSPKECAYDPTALLMAWSSIALGAHALVADSDKKQRWLFAAAGFAAGATFLFKQSTASGVLAGWLLGFAYLAISSRWSPGVRSFGKALGAFGAGVLAGILLLVLTLSLLGSSAGAYRQAVLVDATPLKGGTNALFTNLLTYTIGSAAFPSSLLLCLVIAFVVLRMARNEGLVPSADTAPLDRRAFAIVASIALLTFGSAAVLLAVHVTRIPDAPLYYLERLSRLPSVGLFFVCLFFVVHLTRGRDMASVRGHQQNAMLLVAVVTSLLHNLSTPNFRPFYDNNPIIPFAFLYLFVALERAGLPRLRLAVFALSMLTLYSAKLDRAFRAQARVGSTTHWAGLRLNREGVGVLGAAIRVQELTSETDTVLVLPEDVQLAALIGRPRPPLVGAVVFVDQYPARLADRDIATLLEQPPKVLVIRPSDRNEWRKLFSLWNSNAGAGRVMEAVLDRLLPTRYHLDRSVLTRYGDRAIPLEIWVRNDIMSQTFRDEVRIASNGKARSLEESSNAVQETHAQGVESVQENACHQEAFEETREDPLRAKEGARQEAREEISVETQAAASRRDGDARRGTGQEGMRRARADAASTSASASEWAPQRRAR